MTITEHIIDMAGNHRYLVEVDATWAIPLKYVSSVTDAIVFSDAQKVIDRKAEQEELNSWTPINFDL